MLTLIALIGSSSHAAANTVYSVESLKALCGNGPVQTEACSFYIRGVVESWFVKDIAGVNPVAYKSHNNSPEFCDTIFKVSNSEWTKIVLNDLNNMKPGFASGAVMNALSNQLCK